MNSRLKQLSLVVTHCICRMNNTHKIFDSTLSCTCDGKQKRPFKWSKWTSQRGPCMWQCNITQILLINVYALSCSVLYLGCSCSLEFEKIRKILHKFYRFCSTFVILFRRPWRHRFTLILTFLKFHSCEQIF